MLVYKASVSDGTLCLWPIAAVSRWPSVECLFWLLLIQHKVTQPPGSSSNPTLSLSMLPSIALLDLVSSVVVSCLPCCPLRGQIVSTACLLLPYCLTSTWGNPARLRDQCTGVSFVCPHAGDQAWTSFLSNDPQCSPILSSPRDFTQWPSSQEQATFETSPPPSLGKPDFIAVLLPTQDISLLHRHSLQKLGK